MIDKLVLNQAVIAIIGVGYVGLPLFVIRVMSNFEEVPKVDGVILTAAHQVFQEITVTKLQSIMKDRPILIDVRGFFDKKEAAEQGFYYWTL